LTEKAVGGTLRGAVCPRCRQNAPLLYRGINAYCTACGAPRVPLTGSSLNLAGQPSKVGGTITRILGWIVLAGGAITAALLVGLLAILGAGGGAMAAVGLPIMVIAGIVAYALLRGGKQLQKSGDDTELATRHQAIFALANTRNGVLKAWDAAQALQVPPKEADDILTKLAKEHPDHVSVDIDDQGNVLYRFPSVHFGGLPQMAPNAPTANVRIATPAPAVRVDVPPIVARPHEGERLREDELEDVAPAAREKAR
jgi:hypothetical protein